MKAFLTVAALAIGLSGLTATAAQAWPHHRHCARWVTVWHHHHHNTFCARWVW